MELAGFVRPRGLWAAALLAACNEPTIPERAALYGFSDPNDPTAVFHWPAARLPVRFYGDPRGALRSLVPNAIAAWESQFLYGEFQGVTVTDSLQADVIVGWTGTVPSDVPSDTANPVPACAGSTTNPAAAFKDSSVNVLHIDLTAFSGYPDAKVAACLRRVTVHELGHALGLLQHSPYATDVMHADPTVYLPSPGDHVTVEVLYHTPATIFPPPR